MDLNDTMPEAVAREMPSKLEIQANTWLTDQELSIYAESIQEWLPGGLNWYRRGTTDMDIKSLEIFRIKRSTSHLALFQERVIGVFINVPVLLSE